MLDKLVTAWVVLMMIAMVVLVVSGGFLIYQLVQLSRAECVQGHVEDRTELWIIGDSAIPYTHSTLVCDRYAE